MVGEGSVYIMNNIYFFTMEQYHAKRGVGSTRIRVQNLIKYWDEAQLYKYGVKPDVMVFQKVYGTFDYKLPLTIPVPKILDICDPDFKDTPDIFLVETMNAMDAVVVPTEEFRKFLQQMTKTPVRVIKDRFDLEELPPVKRHKGRAKTIVWFGYSHNAETLKFVVPSLEKRGLKLLVVADHDPVLYKWATNPVEYEKNYMFIKYAHPDAYKDIQLGDIAVLMDGMRPMDKFKSENKTVISKLLGVPVAKDADDLDRLMDADARNKAIADEYESLKKNYDCKKSVNEYKELIDELRSKKS